VLNVVFGKLVPNQICVGLPNLTNQICVGLPNLKLLASTAAEIRSGSQICLDAPLARPPLILVLIVVFGKLLPNPICVQNLMLLASTVAKIRRGSHFFGCSPGPAPANFGPKQFLVS